MKFVAFYYLIWLGITIENALTLRPWVIAHRGASGELPEATLEAFRLAIKAEADVLEMDLVVTKDQQLVVFHDLELNPTTDVLSKPNFVNRQRTVNVLDASRPPSYRNITGCLVHDFTLAELKTLRLVQRFPFRDPSYNGQFSMATFQEVLQLFKTSISQIRLLPELKFPTYFNYILNKSNAMEDLVIQEITKAGLLNDERIMLQCYEELTVNYLCKNTRLQVYQNVDTQDGMNEQLMLQWKKDGVAGLIINKALIATGPNRIGYKYNVTATLPSALVQMAHSMNLRVLIYTLRNENQYIPWTFAQDPATEAEWHDRAKVDGFMTDFPSTLKRVLDVRYKNGDGILRAESMLIKVTISLALVFVNKLY